MNREPRALCLKVVRSGGSGIIGVNIRNVLKQVSNISRCISNPRTKSLRSKRFRGLGEQTKTLATQAKRKVLL